MGDNEDLPCEFCKQRQAEVLVVLTDGNGQRQEHDSCLECPDDRVAGWRAFGYDVSIYGAMEGDTPF